MKDIKEWFTTVKFMKLTENQTNSQVAIMVPKAIMSKKDEMLPYIKNEVQNACEMVTLNRWLEDGYESEEVYYLTKSQSKRFESLIDDIKREVENSKGGLVIKSEFDSAQS